MKWLLVGRFRPVEHPLWSSFVWRNELADTFVEVLAVPWLVGHAGGTPVLTAWLRSMGASIGRGVWLETYWLPESDLVRLGDGATVNRGCVVQTHLFHDRIMSMDEVRIDEGATLGPNGIVLPGAGIGAGTTVGPGSLVTRGDAVPAATRWLGNPITTWTLSRKPKAGAARSGDPYLPAHGNGGYRVEHYELDIDYKLAANRLTGRAVLTAVADAPLSRFSLDLAGVPRAPRARRRPSGEVHAVTVAARQREAARHAGPPGRRAGSPSTCATAATRHRSPADGATSAGTS